MSKSKGRGPSGRTGPGKKGHKNTKRPSGRSGSDRSGPDEYSLKAQREGYPARSVYKLQELEKKFRVLPKTGAVLDVGAAPGSWTVFLMRNLKPGSTIVAVDLDPLRIQENASKETRVPCTFVQGDITDPQVRDRLSAAGPFHAVISDAAPKTTGNRTVDTGRSASLAEAVIELALFVLETGGNLVVKLFQGGEEQELEAHLKTHFHTVKRSRPSAVRKDSFETYLVALGKKGN
ncbi:MAG: RlmE family RNA methyltransferase [Spirochaetales bacterium]|nr:RlmE family RNA methyltransferase [Spirochaetales bacterium]MCF7939339.1 RlmE family RNA methyltransferase [Spirochaetales bacterium]